MATVRRRGGSGGDPAPGSPTRGPLKSQRDIEAFAEAVLGELGGVQGATDPALSALALRRFVRSGVLRFTDMMNAPEKFFLAHRVVATRGLGGFGIRFTVQFNLFAGSIVGLGDKSQLAMLDDIQAKGQLGCFLLTEMQAGVLSGLIVETTADWNNATQTFDLHTPSDKAAKNWISQGYTAELGVVIADLRIDGKSYGPHPFFLRLRDDDGSLVSGIRIEDMGTKTIANDLDNARVWFDHVQLPKSALLAKYCTIDSTGTYQQRGGERMRIEVIGQRLLTGRLCIAQCALVSSRVLHMKTESYARSKMCVGLAGETPLATMPQLANVFQQSHALLDGLESFVVTVEERLCDCLRTGTIPSADLVDALSVCKIRCIDAAIRTSHALRLEVGSYALMHDTGFELFDMLLCCKFAEGDSRILQQKLTRDRLRRVRSDGIVSTIMQAVNVFSYDRQEAAAAFALARKFAPAGRDRVRLAALMDAHWQDIYELSELIADGHIRRAAAAGPRRSFPEVVRERLVGAADGFNVDWKASLPGRAKL